MSVYEFQPGQMNNIEDILELLDAVNADVGKNRDAKSKMILTLGMLGLSAAAIFTLLKGKGMLK